MENPIKTNIKARKKLFWKLWLWIIAGIFLLSIFSLNSDLFKGDIFQGGSTKTDTFYIPDYPANAGDVGDIQIKSTNALSNLAGFSFTLVYNANKISIPNNAVTASGFDFVNSNNISSGKLKVIGASGALDGITLSAGADLVTINELLLSSSLAEWEVLDLTIEDFEVVTSVSGNLTSSKSSSVTAGKITIDSSQIGTLQLLSATAIDGITVKLTFSDYITNVGTFAINNGLFQSSTSIDPDDGKSIIVMTSTQTQGTLYEVTASSTQGNTEGSLSSDNTAYFTGMGIITVASDFNINTASAISGTGVTLNFSDEVLDGSVYTTAFTLTETNNITNNYTILTAIKSVTNGKVVNLTVTGSTILEDTKNYQITLNNSGLSTDLRRQSDSLVLGKNTATFAGYSATGATNVFDINSAESIAANQVKVIFSESLAANTVDINDFSLSGFTVNSVLIPYDGKYNQVLLTLSGSLIAGQYYTLAVNDTNGFTSYSGDTLSASNTTIFVGYGTYTDTSTLSLDSATANSSTEIKLNFSKAPLVSTIIPVNFDIKPTLTITDIKVSGSTVTLTTAVQTEWTLYTIVAKSDKIKDQSDLLISANNTITANGYTAIVPTVSSVTPSQIVNDKEQTILIAGSNFEGGTKIYINTLELTATVKADQITVTIPVDTLAGVYNLILKRPNGEQIDLTNALVIEDPVQNITVLSDESYASPKLVPNDGATKTTLWVRISDPKGVSDIDQIFLDLRPINGSPAATMVAGSIVDTKRWFSLEITVPNTVTTSATPIALEVTAQNKAGDKSFGTVSLTINNDITTSIAPIVEQAYSTPNVLKPGGDEEIYFYAYVTDADGANTINTVVINLWPIGGAPMLMEAVNSSSNSTSTSSGTTSYFNSNQILKYLLPKVSAAFSAPTSNGQWYKTTTAFKLPSNMRQSVYKIEVTATDNTGVTGSLTFNVNTSINQNKPFIDEDRIYVTPRESIPNDNMTVFTVHAFVEDPDGLADITSVIVDLEEINLPPATMKTEMTDGLGAWYKTEELKIPTEVIKGIKTLDIYARDKAGAEWEGGLQIKVTNFDEVGDAPEVNAGKSYTTPNVSINDETTKLTLYAYVSDKDEDVDYVMANLTNVARYTGAVSSTSSGSTSGYYDYTANNATQNPCETNSDTILCMYPSVQEGSDGRWYVLADVVILKEAIPSIEPYRIWVTAVDKTGKSTKGYININVTDGKTPIEKIGTPTLQLASATSLNSVEVLLSNPIDGSSLSKTGKEFEITEKSNTSAKVNVSKAVINTEGNIITLTTSDQTSGTTYTVVADADKLGLKNTQASDVLADFVGYQKSTVTPKIEMVASNSSYIVEVMFSKPIKPTSVNPNGSDFEIFTIDGGAESLKVHRAKIENQQTILITTDVQTSNQKYRIRIKNIASATGKEIQPIGLTSMFRGFQNIVHESSELKVRADFNGDGKVDFTDFTMFSAVYGEMWSALKSGEINSLDEITEGSGITEPFSAVDTTTPVPLTE